MFKQTVQLHVSSLSSVEVACIENDDKNSLLVESEEVVSNVTSESVRERVYPNKLHSPYDLTIVRKMKDEGVKASDEFILTLRGKIKLLREWGVPWKPEEMNRVFNHHGRDWILGFPNVKLEATLLDLEKAYQPTKPEMGKLLVGNPQILALDVDETCYVAEEFLLRNLGFDRQSMRRLIYSTPDILTCDFDHMKTIAGFLRSEIGLHR